MDFVCIIIKPLRAVKVGAVLLLIHLACFATAASDISSISDTNVGLIPDLATFVTNCPAIPSLLMKYTYGRDQPLLCEYRVQSNAFFVRITHGAAFNGSFDPRDTVAGRWENDYWYYEFRPPPDPRAPPRPPELETYHYVATDTGSFGYQQIKEYTRWFGLFTSLGIATGGPGPIGFDKDGDLIYRHPENNSAITAHYEYSNSLPVLASLRVVDSQARVHTKNRIRYHYRADIADGRIPAVIDSDAGFMIEILRVTFTQQTAPLTKASFNTPRELLTAPDLMQIVHTNHGGYGIQGKRIFSMDPVLAAKALHDRIPLDGKRLPGRYKALFIALATVISTFAFVIALKRARLRKYNNTNNVMII